LILPTSLDSTHKCVMKRNKEIRRLLRSRFASVEECVMKRSLISPFGSQFIREKFVDRGLLDPPRSLSIRGKNIVSVDLDSDVANLT